MKALLSPVTAGKLRLERRVVMVPTTRMRTVQGGIPGELMVEYYRQRASQGGLLIAEATAISPYANAYEYAPVIFNDEQQAGWQRLVEAVSNILAFTLFIFNMVKEKIIRHPPVKPSRQTNRHHNIQQMK
ncbi:hypothetical protein PCO86_20390 [Pectobacteriaceae bacterium CE70]|nr:hypothetical protein PCO87_21035 [Pectobacteriaceae bacterium C52]WJV66576.1 hypothetical protein PCO86_20390 [Pectobacteriaceae bacterium CE70]WJY10578.1 hypothetical protein PCO80_20340 [Pectobacteriaceae bacterium C80]